VIKFRPSLCDTAVAEPKGSALLIPKAAIINDNEPVRCTPPSSKPSSPLRSILTYSIISFLVFQVDAIRVVSPSKLIVHSLLLYPISSQLPRFHYPNNEPLDDLDKSRSSSLCNIFSCSLTSSFLCSNIFWTVSSRTIITYVISLRSEITPK
jgi:hypothetical protein